MQVLREMARPGLEPGTPRFSGNVAEVRPTLGRQSGPSSARLTYGRTSIPRCVKPRVPPALVWDVRAGWFLGGARRETAVPTERKVHAIAHAGLPGGRCSRRARRLAGSGGIRGCGPRRTRRQRRPPRRRTRRRDQHRIGLDPMAQSVLLNGTGRRLQLLRSVQGAKQRRGRISGCSCHAKGGARFAGATGRPDLVLLVIRSRSGSDAIVAASPPVTRIG